MICKSKSSYNITNFEWSDVFDLRAVSIVINIILCMQINNIIRLIILVYIYKL